MDECTKKKKKKQKYNNKNSNITVYSIECALQSGNKMKIKHKQKMENHKFEKLNKSRTKFQSDRFDIEFPNV